MIKNQIHIALLLLLLAACIFGAMWSLSHARPWLHEAPMTPAQIMDFQSCAADSECVEVHNGCCASCPVKGEGAVWINRAQESRFKSSFEKNCTCPQCMRVSPPRAELPRCVEGMCAGIAP